MEINEPDWQEMDKAKKAISSIIDGTGFYLSDELKEEIFLQLRKLVLDHARIAD